MKSGSSSALRPALFWLMVMALVAIGVLDFGPAFGIPGAVDAIATVVAGFVFILIHGSIAWGWKNLIGFILITFAISFASEAIGVATGAIFGPYHYTDLLGPKLLGVPLMIQIAYVGVGYASVVIGRIILSKLAPLKGWAIVAASFVGAMIMVCWDLSMDPLQSTAAGDWLWHDGGPYFGVGIQNYVGWFLTVFAFMLVYYLFASRTIEAPRADLKGDSALFWALPPVYYGMMALNVIAGAFVGGVTLPYASSANYAGTPEQMMQSLALVAVFAMGSPVVFALMRICTNRESLER